MEFSSYEHREQVGKWKLSDKTSMVWQCEKCHRAQLTLDELQGYPLRAVMTVLCEKHYQGPVVRHARKALGLTQRELGSLLGYEHETISRWENDKEVMPLVAAQALVGLLCRVLAGERVEELVADQEKAPMSKVDLQVPSRHVLLKNTG